MVNVNWNKKHIYSKDIFGVSTMQSWDDLFFLNEVLNNPTTKLNTIIELGTFRGGLAVFFGLHAFSRGIECITFDIRPEPEGLFQRYRELLPITFHSMDVFSEEAKSIVSEKAEKGRIFLFCDGGEKPMDFATYAPLMRDWDFIFVHDKGREIHQHEVDPIAEANGLTPYYQEEANLVGADIFSFRKHP